MLDEFKNMPNDIVKIIADENLDEIAELAEVGIDTFLDEGLIKDIPLASTVLGIFKTVTNIRDALFIKKIAKFLFKLSELSDQDKKKFSDEMAKNVDLRKKIGEKILLLLEKADDMGKPEIIANLFMAYLRSEIDFSTFSRLSEAINKLSVSDVRNLGGNKDDQERNDRLVSVGLMTVIGMGNEHWKNTYSISKSFFNYDFTEDGKKMAKFAFFKNSK
ncbi:hypothetical protein A2382_02885 [Candidatus Woesebacteria bacterium RIFOXYB1_FULL_38_16]|uniref:Uncharacterized protein n=1 Tax=Candidatus Woesebacteria bacterium RIFOXYB1_FULL_38_16 TaxID=1802538 RepID=A0A1F8CS64_9BACT|nr:MAG: hypothetical protein A2191_04730 [Candidatus Woesebacteria bacterium RIFOXYA1_FULL_38_9]OGM79154.1 MAG: hypothetical protein A2382_02885 [Candidatus Woesebacteria bacterium RIFOXYB1_FULL_38_16]